MAVSAFACGGGGSEPETAAPAAATTGGMRVDAATAGSVMGMVKLDGAAPANEAIRMNADPVCVKQASGPQTQQTYVVGSEGSLGNVFVYVKDGLGNYVFDAPTTTVEMDQRGCTYHPHVFGIRAGQGLVIVNNDPTLHNVHATPKNNREFNTGQPIQGMKSTFTFETPEVMVPFKCDVHGWMNAYVGVMSHPFFAVTGENGSFELKGLPAGTYTVEAWHEKLGTKTQSVTIAASENKADVNFTFTAGAPAATD